MSFPWLTRHVGEDCCSNIPSANSTCISQNKKRKIALDSFIERFVDSIFMGHRLCLCRKPVVFVKGNTKSQNLLDRKITVHNTASQLFVITFCSDSGAQTENSLNLTVVFLATLASSLSAAQPGIAERLVNGPDFLHLANVRSLFP